MAQQLSDFDGSTTLLRRSIESIVAEQRSQTVWIPAGAPLVSVILPTWNRSAIIETAWQSVQQQTYPHWELIVVDDGSTDDTADKIAPLLTDTRFRFLQCAHKGVSAARNVGLQHSRGDIIAYLDSDNYWLPKYLETVVAALVEDANLQSVYTQQVIDNRGEGTALLRGRAFDRQRLVEGNFIDVNVFAHRRSLYERRGGFDERLDRLVDWDLLLRYTDGDLARYLPFIGGAYCVGHTDQISSTRSIAYNRYLIRSKRRPAGTRKRLKVLYALWHYPQLSESYVRTEIAAARQLGVDIEVCAEEQGAALFESDTPIYYDGLTRAIDRFKPDIVHTHWLSYGERYGNQLRQSGLPLTVRGHGFEFNAALTNTLVAQKPVAAVYLFPHFVGAVTAAHPKVKGVPAAFNPAYYYPNRDKDRRLVLRAACALRTKELDTFMRVAQLCPRFRFVLALTRGHKVERILDDMIDLNRAMNAPVEIRVDMQHEDLGDLMRQAAIYLHTAGTGQPYGMPISIAEAMASGCYVIARSRTGSAEYVGDAGALYDTAEEAARSVQATEAWTDPQWSDAFVRSVDRAYTNFVSDTVIAPIVADWHRIAGRQT